MTLDPALTADLTAAQDEVARITAELLIATARLDTAQVAWYEALTAPTRGREKL